MKDHQTEMTASVQYSDLENEHHLFGPILIRAELSSEFSFSSNCEMVGGKISRWGLET